MQKYLEIVFLSLMREQLICHCSAITNCSSLYIKEFCGGFFKIILIIHGYIMIAKGIQQKHVVYWHYEEMIYC